MVLILISNDFYNITLNKVKNIVIVNMVLPASFISNILTLSNAKANAFYILFNTHSPS